MEVEPYYKRQAKDLTDMMHDKGFLDPELTRESVDWLEDYIGFILQSQCQSAAKVAILTAKMKERIAQKQGGDQ
jgi:hypothetical protein